MTTSATTDRRSERRGPGPETILCDQVLQLAATLGWRRVHFRPARTEAGWRTAFQGDRGFPDLVLVRPPELLVVELKSDRGPYQPGQQEWLADLAGAGVETYTWRPRDFDTIVARLSRRRG